MSAANLKTAVTGKAESPLATMQAFLLQHKKQIELALPKHLDASRVVRLALTAFSSSPQLQQCTPKSFCASVLTASQLGLEIGVVGQGWIVPYKTTATFIPGWQGLVDLVSRSGRGTVYTGTIFKDQKYTFIDGARRDLIVHNETSLDAAEDITHTYAVGWVRDSERPIIELWPIEKVRKHRNKYNKVGDRHYSYRDWEMYARKIPLLQVLKYMPKSIELQNAIAAADAGDAGMAGSIVEGQFIEIDPEEGESMTKAEPERSSNAGATSTATNKETGETESLLDTVKRICLLAVSIADNEVAWTKLDDARVILPEMSPENKALATIEINAAEASLKARAK